MTEKTAKFTNNSEGLIQPRKRKSDPNVGPDVIMLLIRTDLDYLLSLNAPGETARYNMGIFDLYRIMREKDEPLFLSGPFLGAPHAVMGMEKLIALGANRIWVLGWCGSLQPSLRIGDLVVPVEAFSEEGTSQHYPIGGITPLVNEDLSGILETALIKDGRPYSKGAVWTTDAPYRETPEKVEFYQKKEVLAVEMEMSALMTLALFRKIKLGALLVVSDELFEFKWHTGFSSPKLKQASRYAGELLMGLAAEKNR